MNNYKGFTYLVQLSLIFLLVLNANSLFSKFYRKCQIFNGHNEKEISNMIEERVPIHKQKFLIKPLLNTRKKIQYKKINYFYHSYLGSGGSGQVYLVEDLTNSKPKVLKRYFKQKIPQFQEQNYIMNKLDYSVQWALDEQNGVTFKTHLQKQSNKNGFIPTMAIYPAKQSISLRDIQFLEQQAPLIVYKLLIELQKTHKNSIIHNDMKMGNILINDLGNNFKFFQTQLIDWNLASFYYLGMESTARKGTVCYFSPQQLMRTMHVTPAIDVWAFAIVMFTFFTDAKPFAQNCKDNNLKAIVTLVGVEKIIQLQRKYRFSIQTQFYELLQEYEQNPQLYKPQSLRQFIPSDMTNFFTNQLIDLFEKMLIPDPEERITISELLNHKYFKTVKNIPPMYRQKQRAAKKQKKKKDPIIDQKKLPAVQTNKMQSQPKKILSQIKQNPIK